MLTEPDDVEALSAGLLAAARLPPTAARAHAVAHCSQDLMIEAYEDLYREVATREMAA